jgi:pimeloyl-ACP methyl ester carboxylesterase
MVADVVAFVESLGPDNLTLMGHSLGGIIGFFVAARRPDLIQSLVLVDPGPEVAPAGLARMVASATKGPDAFDDPMSIGRAALELKPDAPEEEVRNLLDGALKQRDDGRWIWRYDPSMNTKARPPAPELGWAVLSKVQCPTILIRAAESDVLSPEIAARMIHVVPNARLVELPNAGHMSFTDNPAGFIDLLREQIADDWPGSRPGV